MDDYWKIRLQFRTDNELLNMKIHRSEETRRDDWLMRPCLPTSVLYIHAKPYLLEHQPIITVGLFHQPSVDGAIGKVIGVQEEKFVEREVRNAQAWIFVEHGVGLLWECYFFDSFRSQTRQIGFWKAFEKWLFRVKCGHEICNSAKGYRLYNFFEHFRLQVIAAFLLQELCPHLSRKTLKSYFGINRMLENSIRPHGIPHSILRNMKTYSQNLTTNLLKERDSDARCLE